MRSNAFSSPRLTATLPGVRANALYFVHNCSVSGCSIPDKSQSIFKRSRACFAVQNLSATTATPLPFASGISKTSFTPSSRRASLSSRLFTRPPNTGGCATTAIFIPGRSRSTPNFCEPSHFAALSSRGVFLPMSRKSDGFFSRAFSGTGWRAA